MSKPSVSNLVKLNSNLYKFYVSFDCMWSGDYSYSMDDQNGVLTLYLWLTEDSTEDPITIVKDLSEVKDCDFIIHKVPEKYVDCFYIIVDDLFDRSNLTWEDVE